MRIYREAQDLIFQMVAENPTWGAPRIHGELLMLGFDVSERCVSRWMKQAPRNPELARHWLAFLRNHREAIPAMDFRVEESSMCFRLPLAVSTVSSFEPVLVCRGASEFSPYLRLFSNLADRSTDYEFRWQDSSTESHPRIVQTL
jgi:hypothetical protein